MKRRGGTLIGIRQGRLRGSLEGWLINSIYLMVIIDTFLGLVAHAHEHESKRCCSLPNNIIAVT